MQNDVPGALALRTLGPRYDTYVDEVRRLVDAGVAVMRRSDTVNPRVGDVVREAGLSNQAFYRHFPSKDDLLLAILEDGLDRLVATLARRMDPAASGPARVRGWIEGMLAQVADPQAAASTRPFLLDSARLGMRFPDQIARSAAVLRAPLGQAMADAGSSDPDRDSEAAYVLTMGVMQRAAAERRAPSPDDAGHLVRFILAGAGAAAGATR